MVTGQKPLEFQAESDLEEAQFVVEKVPACCARAIFRHGYCGAYRMNSQSRVLENKLEGARHTVRDLWRPSFYERKEIKDVLAYLNSGEPARICAFTRGAMARHRRSVATTICGGAGKARFADAYVPRGG